MFSTDYVCTLAAYGSWATGRLLATAAALEPGQLELAPFAGHPSLRATFVHMLGAESLWRQRWEGFPSPTMLKPAEIPDLDALRERWAIEEAAWRERLATLDDAALTQPIRYHTLSGHPYTQPLWQILAQVFNHATQHRAEVAAMLTVLGHSPGDLDLIVYLRQGGG